MQTTRSYLLRGPSYQSCGLKPWSYDKTGFGQVLVLYF